jgi:hypothetical protein
MNSMVNTGTNLLYRLLELNCVMPNDAKSAGEESAKGEVKRKGGLRFQVPWGKHWPLSFRERRVSDNVGHGADITTGGGEGITQSDVLPIVMIRDPYLWIANSMCGKQTYFVKWARLRWARCPALLLEQNQQGSNIDKVAKPLKVTASYSPQHTIVYGSLVELWNEWYKPWLPDSVSFPRLIVRYEDIVFHQEHVIEQICNCAGGVTDHQKDGSEFQSIVESAKAHHKGASSAGLRTNLLKYHNMVKSKKRSIKFTKQDLEYANNELESKLMHLFHYSPYPS